MGALKLGLVTAILFVVAVVNDWSVPDRLIVTLVVVLVIGWIWTRLSLQRLGLSRSLSLDRLRAGEWITEEFTVSNRSVLPKLWVAVRDHSSLPEHHAGRVVHLAGRGSTQWSVSTRCERRGRFRLGPITMSSGDPLGLFEARKTIPAAHELVVYPPQVDVSDIPMPMANLGGGRATRVNPALVAHQVSGIRDYAAGDPLSRISWNATARLGRMMVKEFDPEPTSDIWVLLDMTEPDAMTGHLTADGAAAGTAADEAIEYAIAVAGSIAERCLGEGRKVGLIVNRTMPIRIDADNAHRQWLRIFETLAVASTFGQRPLFEAIQAESRRLNRNTGLVVITTRPDGNWVLAAQSLVQRQVPVTAVLVRDPHRPDAAKMQALIERLAGVHATAIELSPGIGIGLHARSDPPAAT